MTETLLLVGGGGREHAIARALADDCVLYNCAGDRNPGIAALAAGVETLDATDRRAVTSYAREVGATLAAIGPEAPLEAGVVDALEEAGIYAFGPRREQARIETDKAFQRRFLDEHGIPGNPDFETFEDVERACRYIEDYDGDLAVKPAGLTGGKGVRVIGDQLTSEDAKAYLRESDYDRVVLEERLLGEEFTIQAFVANGEFRASPAVQDHKRAYEGDRGPNTGGMGSYSDRSPELPFMTENEYEQAVSILDATVEALDEYKGILYGQFMLTAAGPKVVEFNARFGDPEAMNTLPVLDTSLLDVLVAARENETLPDLEFDGRATVCKYAVPEGYPEDPIAGTAIEIGPESAGDALVFYASVEQRDGTVYTTTSRAVAIVGIGDSIADAETVAEEALSAAGEGLRVRHDVGTPELLQARIDHMAELRERQGN